VVAMLPNFNPHPDPTPCTLHSAPYTLHPAPFTFHPTSYALWNDMSTCAAVVRQAAVERERAIERDAQEAAQVWWQLI
jgi:hypothetical protein